VARAWGKTWYPIEKSTNEALYKELESKYKTLDEKLKKLTSTQKEIPNNTNKFHSKWLIKQILSYPTKKNTP